MAEKTTDPRSSLQDRLAVVVEQVIPAYRALGEVAYVYAQGALIEHLADEGDLDLVFAWRGDIPAAHARLLRDLVDRSPASTAVDQPGYCHDRFWVSSQLIEPSHRSVAELEADAASVRSGGGHSGYPMPAISMHGLISGLALYDPDERLTKLRALMVPIPEPYRRAAVASARDQIPGYLAELRLCVGRSDGLLFHGLAVDALRILWIGWFAARGLYWPHEKRLGERLRRLGRTDLAALEEDVWSCQQLGHCLDALISLSKVILAESNWVNSGGGDDAGANIN